MRPLIAPLTMLALALASSGLGQGAMTGPWLTATRGALLAALLLAIYFRRGRLATVALLVAAVVELAAIFGAEPVGWMLGAVGRGALASVLAVWLPCELLLLALSSEHRPSSPGGAWRFALLLVRGAFVVWLVSAADEGARWATALVDLLRLELLPAPWLAVVPLPQLALVASLLALVAAGWRLARGRSAFDAALLASVPAMAWAVTELAWILSGGATAQRVVLAALANAAILLVGLIQGAFALAFEDGLTGLPARRALEESLQQLGRTYAVAMVDIDHFKKLNDRHGHEVGDQVLRMVGALLARAAGGCSAYRYGGEEFTLLFPGKTAAQAEPHAEALRATIAERSFAVRSPERPKKKPKDGRRPANTTRKELRVTVSIGVADRTTSRARPEAVMKAADQALYRSKRAGRNRVTRV